MVPGWVPPALGPFPASRQLRRLRARSRERRRLGFAAKRVEWGLQAHCGKLWGAAAAPAGSPRSPAPHAASPPFAEHGQGRCGVARGRGCWWPPASGDSPGSAVRGQPRGREGGCELRAPLPKSQPSTGSCSPLLEIAISRIRKFSSQHVRRGKPRAAGALQGAVKSGNP